MQDLAQNHSFIDFCKQNKHLDTIYINSPNINIV